MPVLHNKPAQGSRRNFVAAASVAALLAIGGTTGANANVASEVGHFVECFGWMISDPDTHADNCLPGRMQQSLASSVETGPDEERPQVTALPEAPEYPEYPEYPETGLPL